MVIEERDTDLESRTSRLEGAVEQVNLRLADMRASMDSMSDSLNARMDSIRDGLNARMDSIESRISAIETRMNIQIVITFGMWATIVGVLLAVIFKS